MFAAYTIPYEDLTASDCDMIEIGEIEVDYDVNLGDMVRAGEYYYPNWESISLWFPRRNSCWYYKQTGQVKVRVVLVRTKCAAGWDMVNDYIKRSGLRCANLPELLTVGMTHPELQRKHHLACCDSSIGSQKIPELYTEDGKREIGLASSEGWPFAAGICFLAVKLEE